MKKKSLVALSISFSMLLGINTAHAAPAPIAGVGTLDLSSDGGFLGKKCTVPTWSGSLKQGKSTSFTCTFKDKSLSMLVKGYSATSAGNGHGSAYFVRTVAKSKSGYEGLEYAATIMGIKNNSMTEVSSWIKSNVGSTKSGKKVSKTFFGSKVTIIGGSGDARTVEIGSL